MSGSGALDRPPSRAPSVAGPEDDAVSVNGSENSSMFGDPERRGGLLQKMRSFRNSDRQSQDIATQLLEARNNMALLSPMIGPSPLREHRS